MARTRVAVVGASGYTGAEIIRLLAAHPHVEITALSAKVEKTSTLGEVFPSLRGLLDIPVKSLDVEEVAGACDLAFLALPHGVSMQFVPEFLKRNVRVIDLSADYRLTDPGLYQQWYKREHTSPGLIADAVYGLPELNRSAIAGTKLLANPGCFPTGALLALLPLLGEGLADAGSITVDAKTGASGAGRWPGDALTFAATTGNMRAYRVACHQHQPEMEQELTLAAGNDVRMVFVPHLAPMSRGILSTAYASVKPGTGARKLRSLYEAAYEGEPFVRILPQGELPQTAGVRGSNFCDLQVMLDERTMRAIIITAIDNLLKGASGQAVQNMNIMLGLEETAGLEGRAIVP